jgi:hypothetical protein
MGHISPATVIATVALIVALGGTSYAAVALAPNSVGTSQIKEGAVQSSDIKDGTIVSADIAAGAIQTSDLSKVAAKALDGKDGKDGAQGPAGPAGATGPAGPAGASGAGSGGSTSCTWVHNSEATSASHTVCPNSDLVGRAISRFAKYADFSGSNLEASGYDLGDIRGPISATQKSLTATFPGPL